ncbi:T9SS type A sorting domain-containing protein [Rufibacter psychrotolerans]|uniref:T9SS type A sorting domain-containing protein n=1 Tax=Rufibacter psychrotolerans TaxID=2812556 RepID=UPI001967E244|nr:T9SS type A sorting domain-containing protein [Rufibacter sp. SYSU D00308]
MGCKATSQGFEVTYTSYTKNSNQTVTLHFAVQNHEPHDLGYVAFELPAGARATNPTHTHPDVSYTLENATQSPFYALKFEAKKAEELKNGAVDFFSFTLTAAQFTQLTTIRVEAKASTTVGQVAFRPQTCQAEKLVITGPTYLERAAIAHYTVPAAPSPYAYEWSAPADWEIVKGQGTHMITVKANGKPGQISVRKGNLGAGTLAVESFELTPTVLPVSLTLFEAKAKTSGQVNLTWATASEKDNKEFIVERSQDGKTFKAIQTLAGAGTSSVPVHYSFQDAYPLPGTSYYRLKQVDYDGASEYSKVVAVKSQAVARKATLTSAVFPNPFVSSVTVRVDLARDQPIRVSLTDGTEKVVKEQQLQGQAGEQTISLPHLENAPAGLYFLRIYHEKEVTVHKLVKNS